MRSPPVPGRPARDVSVTAVDRMSDGDWNILDHADGIVLR